MIPSTRESDFMLPTTYVRNLTPEKYVSGTIMIIIISELVFVLNNT